MPPPEPADLTGRTLGDFHVLRTLGHGGMGRVYLARQLSLKRDVALKLLRDELMTNTTALQRFQAEAEAVARINHPNIVQVYAVGEHDGLKFMALEYVEGRNLRDYLARKGSPELPVALAIIKQVAAALQRAAESGVVHRDIKPENILLTKKVEVKVTDFGLSRLTAGDAVPLNLTQTGVTLGTPLYMAPEQVQGKPTDHRSDLYSLGVTCYHLLAGQPPFTGNTAYEVAMKHCTDQPAPLSDARPDLPADLCALVHKLLAKDPNDRYATAKDVLRDLTRIQKGAALGLPAMPPALSLGVTHFDSTTAVPSGPTLVLPLFPPGPSPWPGRILGALCVGTLFAAGWWAFGRTNSPATAVAIAGPGLPEARLPEVITLATTRERELQEKLKNRQTEPAEYLNAATELGLLYVKERRLPEAEAVFRRLEQEKGDRIRPGLPQMAAKLGLGVVLAQQDKAEESVAMFQSAVPNAVKGPPPMMHQFLLAHPEMSQAVAEALHRDAEMGKGKKLPAALDWLRTPGSLIRGKG